MGWVLGSHGVGFRVLWGEFWGPVGLWGHWGWEKGSKRAVMGFLRTFLGSHEGIMGSHRVGFRVPWGGFWGPMGWISGSHRVVGALGVGEGLKEGS